MAGPVKLFVLQKETQPPFDQVSVASCTGVKVPLLEAKIPKVWALLLLGSHCCIVTLPEAMFRLQIFQWNYTAMRSMEKQSYVLGWTEREKKSDRRKGWQGLSVDMHCTQGICLACSPCRVYVCLCAD
jgi:hypothetical protein